ncbi:hypothetical protein [Streptomyces sp. NPDC023838]|uniref:hypothetical protein n=1 Tax=Streptomyces sp. NPDC023838 TaxID=3154325 RepID=UPI0033F3AF24
MTPGEYARAAALWLLGIGLLSLATLYAHDALWPLSAALGAGAGLCANTALYVSTRAEERAARPTAADQPPAVADAIDGCVAVAAASACCEKWWTSCGFMHEATCHRWRETAR